MKKPDKSPYHLAFLARRKRSLLKKRSRRKSKIKTERRALEGKTYNEQKELKKWKRHKQVTAPRDFTFLENTEGTTKFINNLEVNIKRNKPVFVNLERVEKMDYGAVTVLLSVMNIFKENHINFDGNFPKKIELRNKIIDSQFFDHLSKIIPRGVGNPIKKDNKIFGKGEKKVESALGLELMQEASKTIWGEKRMCKGFQRVLLELMQNTHNHAGLKKMGEECWWITVNHDPENKIVSFGFVDYGQGIFESLNKKPVGNRWAGYYEKIKDRLINGTNAEILEKLLEGELHRTVTMQSFRGKGLPGIKEVLKRNQISNLHIISNDVFSDVEKNEYRTLSVGFKGTFIYWELRSYNENKIWNL